MICEQPLTIQFDMIRWGIFNCFGPVYVMILLLKQRLCIKIDFYDNSQGLDFYDYESHKIIQIDHFLIFTLSKKLLLDFYP